MTRIEHRGPTGSVLDFQAYTYNLQSFIGTRTTPDGTTNYGYDLKGQLTSVSAPDGTVTDYAYDAAGNRLGYGADSANRYATTPTGGSFTYDADGNTIFSNPAGQTQTNYAYDVRGRLIAQTGPTGSFQYDYDALGNRSAVTRDGVRTDLLIDPSGLGNVVSESVGGTVTASYLLGAGLEARFDATGAGSFYHADLQASVTTLTDGTGAITGSYRYSAFGSVTSQTGTAAAANPYRFNGILGVADRGTGTLDMRNRFYDPALGRFTQRDPIGLAGTDANVYRFVNNNPVAFTDPSGLIPVIPSSLSIFLQQEGSTLFVRDVAITSINALRANLLAGQTAAALSPALSAIPSSAAVVSQATVIESAAVGTIERMVFTEIAGGAIGTELAAGGTVAAGGTLASTVAAPIAVGALATGVVILAVDLSHGGPTIQAHYAQNDNVALKPPGYDERLRNNVLNDPIARDFLDSFRRNNPGVEPTTADLQFYLRSANEQRRLQTPPSNTAKGRTELRTPNDPNDIVGPVGFGPQGFLYPAGDFAYTVRFQNKPTATAPAQVVVVTQRLDADLDWESFELQSFGWAGFEFEVPAGLRNYHTRIEDAARNAVVDVNATFNAATGLLTWTLTTLDPVTLDQPADSVTAGFLPPDDATGVGRGFVGYTISPKANAPTGTRYDAQARIVFDTEAPIDTPAIFNTSDRGNPAVAVNTLPATVGTAFTVTWSGADDAGGSGVASYTVFIAMNGAPWRRWLTDTTQTSASYTGAVGDTIAFYAVNADNIGLTMPTPDAAQAFTKISATVPPVPPPVVPPATPPVIPPVTLPVTPPVPPPAIPPRNPPASPPVAPPVTPPAVVAEQDFAVGSSSGVVTIFSPGGAARTNFTPYPGLDGGVRVALADFNGDGVEDVVVATGAGVASRVRVLDGVTRAVLFQIDPFEASFLGGVNVAVGDLTGDGVPDLAVAADLGGGPRVRLFNGKTFAQVADFLAIEDAVFRGGANVAIGDLNGDGVGDLLVAAGFGGGPRVTGYDGRTLGQTGGPKLFADFFALESSFRGGVTLAVADTNGDGRADLVVGGGPGGGPRVLAFDGRSLMRNTPATFADFFAGDETNRDGIRLAVKRLDDSNRLELIVAGSRANGRQVQAYAAATVAAASDPKPLFAFDAFEDDSSAVFVG